MKRFLLLTTTLAGILFYTGCTSVKTVVLNVQKPAEITLPKSIESVGIVNNAVPQPPNFGHNVLKYSAKGVKSPEEVTVRSDSNAILLTEVLFEELSDMNYFKNVSLYEYSLREDLKFQENHRIDSLDIMELAQIMNVDAIISLDRFLSATVSHSQPISYDTENRFLDLNVDAVFRIYSKDGNIISPPLYFRDSLYWEDVRSDGYLLTFDSIPNREDAVNAGIIYTAEKIARSLTPQWEEEYRTYYGDVKEANKEVESDNWQQALNLWTDAYETEQKNIKKKARLAGNIALAHETSDNLKEALKWADIAVKLFGESAQTGVDENYKKTAITYYNHLLERYQESKILDLQDRDFD